MKNDFKWQVLSQDSLATVCRAPVFGGWIILNTGDSQETGDEIQSSMVFVPDANHEWQV